MAPCIAPPANDEDLVITVYHPNQSHRTHHLQRSAALSHAAKVSHARRQVAVRSKESANRAPGQALPVKARSKLAPRSAAKDAAKRGVGGSPLQAISQGGCDPFNSTALRITPEVSMLLGLWRAHNESNIVSITRRLSEESLRQDLTLMLENALHATSLLFISSALLSLRFSDRADLQVRRLERKRDCLKQLNKSIVSQPATNQLLTIRGLSMVFMGAVLSNEPVEAKIHAKQLLKALMPLQFSNEPAQRLIFCRVYYYDEQCALMYMRPPVLDPKVPMGLWKKYLAPIHQWVQNHTRVPGTVRYPAFSSELVALFRRLQEYINIQCVGVPELSRHIKDFTLSTPVIVGIEITGLLFGHLEFAESQSRDEVDGTARQRWQIENILAHAALAFLACAVSGAQSLSRLSERGDKAFQNLRGLLQKASYPVEEKQNITYQHSQLWALYVGAMWEWDSGTYDSGDKWFTVSLQQRIQELGIQSWTDLTKIVHGFLYIPSQLGCVSIWFPGMDRSPPDSEPGSQHPTSSQFLKGQLFSPTPVKTEP